MSRISLAAWLLLPALALSTACSDDGKDDDSSEAGGSDDGGGDDGGGDDGGGDDGGGDDGGGDDGGGDDGGDDGGGSHEYVDRVQASCTEGEVGAADPVAATVLQAEVTWTLDFDSDAEAAGWTDCFYTREYTGVQRLDVPHLCPGCDVIVEGDATMTVGFTDCAEPLFGGEEVRTETWGLGGSDVYRRSGSQYPLPTDPLATLADLSGDGSEVAVGWDSEYGVNNEDGDEVGRFTMVASGTMAWESDDSVWLDVYMGPRESAYACGWECNDPGDLGGSYPLAPDEVLPNFRLQDQCDELVDIHDFYGSYLVLDSAQSDCGPCLSMAEAAEPFRETLVADGIPVRLIPLLGAGLSDVGGTPNTATHQAWVDRFTPVDPVLADRGWGYAALGQYLPDHEGEDIAWPAWIIIAPDMTVLQGGVGFGDWSEIGDIIRADWAARGETGPL